MLTIKFLAYLASCGIFFSVLLLVWTTISEKTKIVRIFCYAAYFGLGGLILSQNEIIAFTMFAIGVVLGALSSNEFSDENILEKLSRELKKKGSSYKLEEFSMIIEKTLLSLKSKKIILAQIEEEMKKAVWFRKQGQDLLVIHIFREYPAEYQKFPMTTFLTVIGK